MSKNRGKITSVQQDIEDFEVTSQTEFPHIDFTGEDFVGKHAEGTIQSEISQLTERVETLTNLTGQFYTEINEQPAKWVTQIYDLGDESYILKEPILILIEEYSDDSIIARFPEVEVFGEGVTDSEAISNLKNSILDLYDELTETDSDTLGKLPKMWLRILDRIITKV